MTELERFIVAQIEDPQATQNQVAETYAQLIADKHEEWATINQAIRSRWKHVSSLNRVKGKAWRCLEEMGWRKR